MIRNKYAHIKDSFSYDNYIFTLVQLRVHFSNINSKHYLSGMQCFCGILLTNYFDETNLLDIHINIYVWVG